MTTLIFLIIVVFVLKGCKTAAKSLTPLKYRRERLPQKIARKRYEREQEEKQFIMLCTTPIYAGETEETEQEETNGYNNDLFTSERVLALRERIKELHNQLEYYETDTSENGRRQRRQIWKEIDTAYKTIETITKSPG